MSNKINKRMTAAKRRWLQDFARTLVLNCVRNTPLEDLHAGVTPSSARGDYSDVKVVSPFGEIPWNNLSRISDEEMKALMIDIVDRVYTVLWAMQMDRDILLWPGPKEWNVPKLNKTLMFTREDLERKIREIL